MLRPGLVFAFLAAAFWWTLITFVPSNIIVELLTGALVPVGAVGLWRWAPGAVRNLWAHMLTPAKILTIAVTTLIFSAVFGGIWRLIYLWLHRPPNMTSLENPWAAFPVFLAVLSLVLYLISTRRESDPPMPQLMWVVAVGAVTVLALGFAIRLFGLGTLVL